MRVKATLGNLRGQAGGTADAIRPPQLAHRFVAFRVIDEGLNIHEHVQHRLGRIGQSYRKYCRLLETPNEPYFANKHPNRPALTTAHVERITNHFLAKVASANAAKVIRQGGSQYLTADKTRKQGRAVNYTINRRGVEVFDMIMQGQNPEGTS